MEEKQEPRGKVRSLTQAQVVGLEKQETQRC